ncbi:AIPR family protein [Bradyrhizobium sp. B117]|uniref:AIPR family protein n=1 Tax=Bradyrhizobium sp. B117 TaxID=3140246 RepID=UPI00318422CA
MTAKQQKYPTALRKNLTDQLGFLLNRRVDEDEVSFDKAFSQIALDILGYEPGSGTWSDGRGDFGVDYWIVEEKAATIFQFKSHDFTAGLNSELLADSTYLGDLPRIRQLLQHLNEVPKEANQRVQEFIKEVGVAIHRYSATANAKESPFEITIFFCCLANGLTKQAAEEYARFSAPLNITWSNQLIHVSTFPIFIDELIAERWRESNTDWRTANGERDDKVELHVRGEMISSAKSAVFFTKAYDLVSAFDRFGYQLFEPNVRCELRRSKVNEKIRESVRHSRGRREFKHLNNGITLICSSFQKVNRQIPIIRIVQPGVINGLQTVKSVHDAFDELSDSEKAHFEQDCEVLVRLHTREAVADYKELVKSTNNQNPMQPRNLRSNEQEQIYFESLFADMNWFYERKEGAWKAFQSDSKLWGSLKGKRVADFKIEGRAGGVRNVDNLELAQAWLSFIGFSNEAIHNKRDIFSDEKFYDLVFKQRVAKHGYDYNFAFNDPSVRSEAEQQAPSPQALLLSELLREIADGLTPTRKQNRDDSVKRLKLDKLKKEEQDAELVRDSLYTRGLVLAGAKYLFVDFCGLVFFRSLGLDVYRAANWLLNSRSMKPFFAGRDLSPMQAVIKTDDFEVDDVIAVLWGVYSYCLEMIIEQPSWRQQFEQAAVRSRFNYSDYNRRTLFGQLENLDRVYQKRAIPQPWSEGIEKHRGIFAFVKAMCGRK